MKPPLMERTGWCWSRNGFSHFYAFAVSHRPYSGLLKTKLEQHCPLRGLMWLRDFLVPRSHPASAEVGLLSHQPARNSTKTTRLLVLSHGRW